jgi:hypothetical protein
MLIKKEKGGACCCDCKCKWQGVAFIYLKSISGRSGISGRTQKEKI